MSIPPITFEVYRRVHGLQFMSDTATGPNEVPTVRKNDKNILDGYVPRNYILKAAQKLVSASLEKCTRLPMSRAERD